MLRSTVAGTKVVTATVDGSPPVVIDQTASVVVNPATTTTAIVSDLPDPSMAGQAVTVTYTVTSAGGTPTGDVMVTVDDVSGNSCSAPVGAGGCDITLTTPGSKTLTATYGGDASFAGSVSAPGTAHMVTTP